MISFFKKNMLKQKKPLGLIFAMNEEQQGLELHITNKKITSIANRSFIQGTLWGYPIISVVSGIGKVAASTTATTLINTFNVDQLILMGVAGATDANLRVGDVVIATELLQHDMNAFPISPRFVVPLINKSRFLSNALLNIRLEHACKSFFENQFHQEVDNETKNQFALHQVKIHQGLIASGDQFIANNEIIKQLKHDLPDLLAIEMEGAAIAQVCNDFELPFAVLRTISDSADETAHGDFQAFVKKVAAQYSLGILKELINDLTL